MNVRNFRENSRKTVSVSAICGEYCGSAARYDIVSITILK